MKKEKRQKMCLEIIDQFEQLLEKKDISIPCEDSAEEKERHDGGNNARIYGAEYWRDNRVLRPSSGADHPARTGLLVLVS